LPENSSRFRSTFDPEEWSLVYDGSKSDPEHFAFRRSSELAREACFRHSQRGELWLDVGCGTGHLAAELTQQGLVAKGVDADPAMIAYAHQRFPALIFQVSNANHLPFSAGEADGIIATSVMGCLESAAPFFQEAHRVLRRNGLLILTFTNAQSFLLRLNARLRDPSATHDSYHLYSAANVSRQLRENHFEVREIQFYNFFLNPSKKLIPSYSMTLFLERLGKFGLSRYLARNFLITASKS
jgi:ubiquinone/menaquinone biosynthesis C-methylase UbiE